MEKMISIDYEEYDSLYKLVDEYKKKLESVNTSLREKEDFISKIKENANEILVITKNENGDDGYTFKSDEKVLMEKIVDLYNKMDEKCIETQKEWDIVNSLYIEEEKKTLELQKKYSDIQKKLNKSEKKISFYENLGFFGRLFNKKQK